MNVGVAEAIVQDGEIKSLNILNQGMGFLSTDALFVKSADGTTGPEVNLESGSLHGYQQSRLIDVENFRTSLNAFVSSFVEEVNEIYNPLDAPSEYLFGFKANLTRATMGTNTFMEDLGLYGSEGNGELRLFRNESNMILPFGESDTFTLSSISTVVPDDLPEFHPDPTKLGLSDFKLRVIMSGGTMDLLTTIATRTTTTRDISKQGQHLPVLRQRPPNEERHDGGRRLLPGRRRNTGNRRQRRTIH